MYVRLLFGVVGIFGPVFGDFARLMARLRLLFM
jgi:hypothetical protein